MSNIVVISGGFDPIHSGHLQLIDEAAKLGKVVVALNSDEWLARKNGKPFMNFHSRLDVLRHIKGVHDVMPFDDSDDTCKEALEVAKISYPKEQIIFANGGDRNSANIPELDVKDVLFKFGVGGDYKKDSSSSIKSDWATNETARPWGHYSVLWERPGLKLKELVIEPWSELSNQRHMKRSEVWFISEGSCSVKLEEYGESRPTRFVGLNTNDTFHVGRKSWHQLRNTTDKPCHIIEIQYGDETIEEDIERDEY